jgi:hypothetical protein
LVESHLQAVWLANAHVALDVSIAPMLDLDQPGKPLIKSYLDALNDPATTQRAQEARHASLHSYNVSWPIVIGFLKITSKK